MSMNDSRCSMVSTTTRRSVPLFIAAGLGISLGLAPVVAPPSAFGNEITTTTEVESAAFNVSSAEELQQAFDTIMSDEYQGKGTIRLTQNIEVTSPIRVHVGNIVQPRITIEGNNNTITFDCAVSEAPIEVA